MDAKRTVKIINKSFAGAFALIGTVALVSVFVCKAWHQLFVAFLCLMFVLVLRADNKRIEKEGNEIIEFTEE